MNRLQLYWLPENPGWNDALRAVGAADQGGWDALTALANCRMDFMQTERLDKAAQRRFGDAPPTELAAPPVRLAILGSSTVAQLQPAIRVGLLRRRIWATTYTSPYGQYLQDLLDPNSGLHAFKPTVVLFAFDARHALGKFDADMDQASADRLVDDIAEQFRGHWELARRSFSCAVIQQTILSVFPALLGNNEHRLPGSPSRLVARINARIAELADQSGIDLLSLDARAAEDGIAQWHDPVLWHRAKMEVAPPAAPFYGDLVARIVAAQVGRSFKCLVLDLDNTLWGGVVGDDGVEGLTLGQGSALGEAYVAFQDYARQLSQRGVILAVCSKNDEANALGPFTSHPEMVLKRHMMAAFVANWTDKATNIRTIAKELNIGLDALVFADDNPFERNLIRQELPMVAVPELPEDPAYYAPCIADAGYFEGISVTSEDRARTGQYRANAERESLRATTSDLTSYLRSLEMEMRADPFDAVGLARITQLINKTNQFNLTTRRYTEHEVGDLTRSPDAITLQIRLTDKFGDNGMIAVVIAQPGENIGELAIDTWLMSCRVLGRQVEQATLNVLVGEARQRGFKTIRGEFRPTAKNAMVRDHYATLGFKPAGAGAEGQTFWTLAIDGFTPFSTFIKLGEMVA
jgi:FkbH-like protein